MFTRRHVLPFLLILCCIASFLTGASKPEVPSLLDLAKKNVIRMSDGNGSCSGTIINSTTLITAAHCVPPPSQNILTPFGILTVFFPPMKVVGSDVALSPGLVVPYVDGATMHGKFDVENDVAVDEVDGDVFVAEKVVICGYPIYSNKLRCTVAEHAKGEDGRLLNRIFHALFKTISIPGQSGGGVFSLDGKLIGMVSAGTEDGYTEVVSTAGLLSQEPEESK